MAKGDPPKRGKLGDSIQDALASLEKYRIRRQKLIQVHAADLHPAGDEHSPSPANLLEVARNAYTQELMPGDLRALVTPRRAEARVSAMGLEHGTNQRIVETDTAREVAAAINESMFAMGIIRVAEESTGPIDVPGLGEINTSATGVRHIPGNRFFYDTLAERWHQMTFAGDIFTVPLKWAKEFKQFNRAARDSLEPLKLRDVISPAGTRHTDDSRGEKDRYMPQTQLLVTWLPSEGPAGKIVTLTPKNYYVLDEVDWDGPDEGPYHQLSYNDVLGEIAPIAPLEILRAVNRTANVALEKIRGRIERSKEVGLVRSEDEELVKALRLAVDGSWERMGNSPDPVEILRLGGIGGDLMASLIQMRSLFSWLGGGIDILSGLRPMSETLGQDRILSAAASKRVASMAKRVEAFVRAIVRALAWYEWTDPIRERMFNNRIERRGIQYNISMAWTPATRTGSFLDFDVQIDVYALQHRSPEERAQALLQTFSWLMPLLPLLQQQGATVDVNALARLLTKLRDLPELAEIVHTTTNQPVPFEMQPPAQGGPRNNEGPRPARGENNDENLIARMMATEMPPATGKGGPG